jgi:hypothetical protein
LEKTGCEHVKAVAQAEVIFSAKDTKEPSVEASLLGGKFYSDVWTKGGREMFDEAIKKNEKKLTTPEKRQSKLKKLLNEP